VSDTDPLLDRSAIEEAFRRLGDRLARRGLVADVRFLVRRLRLSSPEQVLSLVVEVFPEERLPERARLILEEVFEGTADT
jgi:hypothetical protein